MNKKNSTSHKYLGKIKNKYSAYYSSTNFYQKKKKLKINKETCKKIVGDSQRL